MVRLEGPLVAAIKSSCVRVGGQAREETIADVALAAR